MLNFIEFIKKYGVYESQGNYDSQIDYSTVSSIKLYNSEFIFLVSELNLTSVQLQALSDVLRRIKSQSHDNLNQSIQLIL